MTIMLDISTDLGLADGLESVTLRFPSGHTYAGTDISINTALRRRPNTREMMASQGMYQANDVKFNLQASQCTHAPEPGCLLIDGDSNEYTILEARKETVGTRWACLCRDLIVSERLDTVIKIQEATYAKGATGAEEATWTDLFTDVRAKIQAVGGDTQEQHGRRVIHRKYVVYVREPFVLRRQHRIVDHNGGMYRVLGFDHPEKIDRLTEIKCEEFQGGL